MFRTLLGLVLGYLGILAIAVAAFVAVDVGGVPVPPGLAQAAGPLLLLIYLVLFVAIFRYFRGGRCVLSAEGVELHYRGHAVTCPWSLFQTHGKPHLLPGKDVLLIPIASVAVPHVAQYKTEDDEPHTRGLAVQTPHWKFQSAHQAVLKPVYEVNPEEFAKFLLGLGQLLGRDCSAIYRRRT